MKPVLDKDGLFIPSSSDDDYRLGRTIVLPDCYDSEMNQRFFYNFNNPAVREYCVRVALKTDLLYSPRIFLDNYGVFGSMTRSVNQGLFHEGNKADNLRHYANQLAAVCTEIKGRAGEILRIIANVFFQEKL
jgi:hypothetical protein